VWCIVTRSISLLPLHFSESTAIDFSSFAVQTRKLPDKFVLAGSGRYRTHNDKRSFIRRGSKEERKPGRFKTFAKLRNIVRLLSSNCRDYFCVPIVCCYRRLFLYIMLSSRLKEYYTELQLG